MNTRNAKLTRNSGETNISDLLSSDAVFVIPYFQRPYKWKLERIRQFNDDMLKIVDQTTDAHFLGAIITHGRGGNPSDPKPYDVIDGQQRLTTIFITILAVIKQLCAQGQYDDATGLFQKYVAIGRSVSLTSNLKLHSCKEDREQLNLVLRDVMSDTNLRSKVGSFAPKYFPLSGAAKGTLLTNYKIQLKFLKDQLKQGGIDRVRAIYEAIFNFISIVQIDVFDPTSGPKIFDSLNSRQEPMTIGDLVRNEIFSKVVNENVESVDIIDSDQWQPFYNRFKRNDKNYFDEYFFPFGLILNPNLSKSEVYNYLRDQWRNISLPQQIISNVEKYQNSFLDIRFGENNSLLPIAIHQQIKNFRAFNGPTSAYPFYMRLIYDASVTTEHHQDIYSILLYLEAFFVRRAIVGIEPTGLHAVFKRLWPDLNGDLTLASVKREIAKHRTVQIPNDEDVKDAIKNRPLYGSKIDSYLIESYNLSLGGDVPTDRPWIEHVLPQNLNEHWASVFTADQHKSSVDVFANLIPLSARMNRSLSDGPYGKKSDAFKSDAMFKCAREFGQNIPAWTPEALTERSKTLANWVVERWRE